MKIQQKEAVLHDREIYNFFAGQDEITYQDVIVTQTNLYENAVDILSIKIT